MEKFEIFKTEIIKRCKEKLACEPEFKRILESKNFEQITKVLTDNFIWSCNNDIIDCELIEPLNDELKQFKLCANIKKVTNCFILLNGSSSAELNGSSSAVLYDSSSAELNGSSSAVLNGSSSAVLYNSSSAVLYDSSSAVLYDSSSAVLFNSSSAVLYDSSSAELNGSSSAKLNGSSSAVLNGSSSAVLFNSSSAVLYGSSSAELNGSSSAELNGSSYVCSYNILEHKISDKAICRYFYQNKIIVSKTTEIITY